LVTEVDFVAEDVDVEKFPDVLFPLVGIKSFFGGEPFPDFGELVCNSLGLGLLIFAGSDI
jgi:hypothetical protein